MKNNITVKFIKAVRKIDFFDVIPETESERKERIADTVSTVAAAVGIVAGIALVAPYKVVVNKEKRKLNVYALTWNCVFDIPAKCIKQADGGKSEGQSEQADMEA